VVTPTDQIPVTVILDTGQLPLISGQVESEAKEINGSFRGYLHGTRLTLKFEPLGDFQGELHALLIVGTTTPLNGGLPRASVTLFAATAIQRPEPGMYPVEGGTA
jgi:hypothetical protein